MKAKVTLFIGHKQKNKTFDTRFLDRNYSDENYAYWIFEDDFGAIHEVNIDKDSDGFFEQSGIDNVWFNRDSFENSSIPDSVSDLKFSFSDDKDSFCISRLSKEDLESIGFDTSNVNNKTMEKLAEKLGEDYCNQLFWDSLGIFAEFFSIPQK